MTELEANKARIEEINKQVESLEANIATLNDEKHELIKKSRNQVKSVIKAMADEYGLELVAKVKPKQKTE